MRKLVSTFAAVALLFALNANAASGDPKAKAKKKEPKTEKSCSTEEKKACATGEKKAGCCAAKKTDDKKA